MVVEFTFFNFLSHLLSSDFFLYRTRALLRSESPES